MGFALLLHKTAFRDAVFLRWLESILPTSYCVCGSAFSVEHTSSHMQQLERLLPFTVIMRLGTWQLSSFWGMQWCVPWIWVAKVRQQIKRFQLWTANKDKACLSYCSVTGFCKRTERASLNVVKVFNPFSPSNLKHQLYRKLLYTAYMKRKWCCITSTSVKSNMGSFYPWSSPLLDLKVY